MTTVINEEEWRRRRRILNRFGYIGQYGRLGDAIYAVRRRAENLQDGMGIYCDWYLDVVVAGSADPNGLEEFGGASNYICPDLMFHLDRIIAQLDVVYVE